MKVFFLCLLLIISLTALSQKNIDKKFPEDFGKGNYININLLSIFDTGLPTIQPGYEYKFNKKLGLEIAVGIPFPWIGNRTPDSTFYEYYKIRSTFKYYIGKFFFIGLESFYTRAHYSRYYYNYYLGKYGSRYSSDFSIIRKSVIGFDFKTGVVLPLGKKIYVGNFTGLGIRFVNIKLPVNMNPRALNYYSSYAFQILDIVGTKITPHLTFGLQVTYKL